MRKFKTEPTTNHRLLCSFTSAVRNFQNSKFQNSDRSSVRTPNISSARNAGNECTTTGRTCYFNSQELNDSKGNERLALEFYISFCEKTHLQISNFFTCKIFPFPPISFPFFSYFSSIFRVLLENFKLKIVDYFRYSHFLSV